MKRFVVFFLAGNFLFSAVSLTESNVPGALVMERDVSLNPRVIGGEGAFPGEFPYMLSLKKNGYHICGASFLEDTSTGLQYGLTAAHCFYEFGGVLATSELTVTGGTILITGDGLMSQSLGVAAVIEHPDYNQSSFENDIAILLFLNKFNVTEEISPTYLAEDEEAEEVERGIITGWGYTNFSEQHIPDILQTAEVSIFGREECQRIFNTSICAGNLDAGISGCHYDSGGPLVFQKNATNKLIGITSGGLKGCPAHDFPGIYTKVPNFTTWITNTLKSFCYDVCQ